jgi:hypothetical protein
MTARHANELLYDSEAALRLVDSAIEDIREAGPRASTGLSAESLHAGHLRDLLQAAGPLGLLGISKILARGHGEILSVLGSLRESRDVLARTSSGRAASDILDGLDRAVALVDQLDAEASDGDATASANLRNTLREELSSLVGCMQFQDIAAQQLSYASSVLSEVETRLAELASILGPAALGAAGAPAPAGASGPITFDPLASMANAEARQAVADEIFSRSHR